MNSDEGAFVVIAKGRARRAMGFVADKDVESIIRGYIEDQGIKV